MNVLLSRKFFGNQPEDKQDQSQGYGRVGNVKSRPVIVVPVEIDEIDHLSPAYTIYEIAYGTTKNEGKGDSSVELFSF